jgi:hypothetical protein
MQALHSPKLCVTPHQQNVPEGKACLTSTVNSAFSFFSEIMAIFANSKRSIRIMLPHKTNQYIAAGVIFFVNLLFAYKYSIRVSIEFGILFTLLYATVLSILFFYRDNISLKPVIYHFVFFSYVLLLCIGLFYIDKITLNVDRWEMISIFFDSLSKGIDPYSQSASNGNYPAGLPFYFLLYAPFHFVGEIAIATLLMLSFVYMYYVKKNKKNFFIYVYAIIFSVAMIWEVLTRSTLIVNTYLIFFILLHVLNIEKFKMTNLIVSGIITGLLLSTRTVLAFVFIIWGIYELKQKYPLRKLFILGLFVMLAFVSTLLPFVLIWSDTFFERNPFSIQSTLLFDFLIPVTIAFAVIFGFLCKQKSDVVFYSGMFLFVVPLLEFFVKIRLEGITESWLNSYFDISYLLFCFPFFIHVLIERPIALKEPHIFPQ